MRHLLQKAGCGGAPERSASRGEAEEFLAPQTATEIEGWQRTDETIRRFHNYGKNVGDAQPAPLSLRDNGDLIFHISVVITQTNGLRAP